MSSKQVIRVAVIGAGGRGRGFGQMIADECGMYAKVVAVAEPDQARRSVVVERHGLSPEMVFEDWQAFVARPKMCDAVVIATMDRDHHAPAVACLKLGYHVLLEKPMAATLKDCQEIEAAQRKAGTIVSVCHSLRYHKGFRKVKELLDGGAIGRIMTIDLLEQVGHLHYAHSYVRANWGNESRSTFMLMAKSCHDIDYLCYLVPSNVSHVSSFGSLKYFNKSSAPVESADRCTSDCPHEPTCPYSAIRIYAGDVNPPTPTPMISPVESRKAWIEALRTGPLGRCVWKCDNDVVDHQVVAMEFERGVTATFTMTGFTQGGGRRLRVHGTEADLYFDETSITIRPFASGGSQRFEIGEEPGGHGGGDSRVLKNWLLAILRDDPSLVWADAQESLRSHTVVFAAEQARREKRVVQIDQMPEAVCQAREMSVVVTESK